MSIRPELRLDSKGIRFYYSKSTKWGSSIFFVIYSLQHYLVVGADTEIVSTAVEHLHSNTPVLTKACVSDKNVKATKSKKVRSSVRYLKDTIFLPTSEVCDCTTRLFGSDTVSGFCFGPSKRALIEEFWFYLVDELVVLFNIFILAFLRHSQ